MNTALNNHAVYSKHNENIDEICFLQVKKFVLKYFPILTEKERDFIQDFIPTTANIYGLPKVHKSEEIKNAIKNCEGSYIHVVRPKDLKFRFITGGPNAPTT